MSELIFQPYVLFCFSAIFSRLAKDEQIYVPATRDHINEYSESGLRTMVIAYCMVIEEEFNIWYEEFSKASNSVSYNRDEMVDAAAEKIERDLILLGATAVEDRLQKGDYGRSRGRSTWNVPLPHPGDRMQVKLVDIGLAAPATTLTSAGRPPPALDHQAWPATSTPLCPAGQHLLQPPSLQTELLHPATSPPGRSSSTS
ncbi:putative phospholipid-transporting ATPase 4 [Platanthera zijinensis]|uniref:Phospholipid-transporting ATPase 4 n=1 Tax=Platanthera zijinensis TaxID=2320716 RepID=A0AAP0C162_9ASPA